MGSALKFPCKGVRKIEFAGYNEGFTCMIRFGDICDARDAYIVPLDRGGMKIKGYRRNGRSLREFKRLLEKLN